MIALAAPDKVDILFAEGFREEVGDKMTLIGFYPGDTIIIGGEGAGKSLAALALVIVLSGNEFRNVVGTFPFDVSIKSPSGKVVKFNGNAVKEAKKSITLGLKWIGFPVPE